MFFFRNNRSRGGFPHTRPKRGVARLKTLAGIVWASPLSLCGLVLTVPILIGRGRLCLVQAETPALLISGRVANYMLARHPFGAMCAMAIGHVVIADRQSLTPRILTHELAHVRQAAVWGALFPFAYCASSLWAVMRGRDAYWFNSFEEAARREEQQF